MSGHRHAALALYSLAESDQRAILAELPESDQKTLRAYLSELAELGFDKAANSDAIDAALPAPADAQDESASRALLRRAGAAAMLSLLGSEPAGFVACLLAIEPWPWAGQFIGQQTPARRAVLSDAARDGLPAALSAVAAAIRSGLDAARTT